MTADQRPLEQAVAAGADGPAVPESEALARRAERVLPGGNTRHTVYFPPHPIYAVRGEGYRVLDVDGLEYVDCANDMSALLHGHCPDRGILVRRLGALGELLRAGLRAAVASDAVAAQVQGYAPSRRSCSWIAPTAATASW